MWSLSTVTLAHSNRNQKLLEVDLSIAICVHRFEDRFLHTSLKVSRLCGTFTQYHVLCGTFT
jgi:hypothetical protein